MTESPKPKENTEARCNICDLDPYETDYNNKIISEAVANHEFNMIKIGKCDDTKYFCPNTHERIGDEEMWEEMTDEENKVASREYVVKVGKKWEIRLKGEELKV